MPIIQKFKIGDIVDHEKFRQGIILGNCHKRQVNNYTMQFYHVYYTKHNTFGYAAKLTLISPATNKTEETANEILMNMIQNNNNRFKFGDIIDHPKYGRGIILGNGHKRKGRIYYHVYYANTKTFGYNATFSLISETTPNSIKQAKDLLFKNVLPKGELVY